MLVVGKTMILHYVYFYCPEFLESHILWALKSIECWKEVVSDWDWCDGAAKVWQNRFHFKHPVNLGPQPRATNSWCVLPLPAIPTSSQHAGNHRIQIFWASWAFVTTPAPVSDLRYWKYFDPVNGRWTFCNAASACWDTNNKGPEVESNNVDRICGVARAAECWVIWSLKCWYLLGACYRLYCRLAHK